MFFWGSSCLRPVRHSGSSFTVGSHGKVLRAGALGKEGEIVLKLATPESICILAMSVLGFYREIGMEMAPFVKQIASRGQEVEV